MINTSALRALAIFSGTAQNTRGDSETWFSRVLRTTIVMAGAALTACASVPPHASQVIEVRVQAENQSSTGPFECEASNAVGRWQFVAPGSVSVDTSSSRLRINCKAPEGAVFEENATESEKHSATGKGAWEGAKTGAMFGAGFGFLWGAANTEKPFVALAPLAGLIYGVLIGGVAGAATSQGETHYPSPLVIRLRAFPSK